MGDSDAESAVVRLKTPRFHEWRWNAFLYTIVIFFVALAIFHLWRFPQSSWVTIIAAVTWLSFIAFSIHESIYEDGGVRQWLVNRLSDLSRHHFIEANARDDDPPTIRFGCEIFAWCFYVLEIPSSAISSVDWHTGQASALAGEDRNDWYVTIWYHHPDRPKAKRYPWIRDVPWVRDEELHIITGEASREKVDAFGKAFVAFLQRAGVKLKSTENPTEFTRTGKSIQYEMVRRARHYVEDEVADTLHNP